jgi:hypothetical protein
MSIVNQTPHPIDPLINVEKSQLRNITASLGFNSNSKAHLSLLSKIVPLKAKKQLATTIISRLVADFSTTSQDEIFVRTALILRTLKDEMINEIELNAKRHYEHINQKLKKILDQDTSENDLRKLLLEHAFEDNIIDLITEKYKAGKLNEETFESIISTLSYTFMNMKQKEEIHQIFNQLIKKLQLIELKRFQPDEVEHIFVFGPAGSGKSAVLKSKMESGTLEMSQVLRFTPDDLHQKVIHLGGTVRVNSDEKHDFLQTSIFDAIEEEFFGEGSNKKSVPRIVREFIVPTPERIEKFGGEKVEFHLALHLNINNVIKGAQERARDTGRSVDIKYIVNGQIAIAENLPSTLDTLLIKPQLGTFIMNSTTHIHDRNLPEPKAPVAICSNENLLMISLEVFIRFNAEKKSVLDLSKNQCTNDLDTDEAVLDLFMRDYENKLSSFVFINPEVNIGNIQDLNDEVYAYVNDNEFIITNHSVFNKVNENSPLVSKFFEQLRFILRYEFSVSL